MNSKRGAREAVLIVQLEVKVKALQKSEPLKGIA